MKIKHCGISQVFTACTTGNCQIVNLVTLQTVLFHQVLFKSMNVFLWNQLCVVDPIVLVLLYLSLLVVELCNCALGCRRGTELMAFKLFLHAGQSAWQRARLRAVHDLITHNKLLRHIHKYTYT